MTDKGLALVTEMLVLLGAVVAYSQSLADCKAVAARFMNTCAHGDYDTPAASVSQITATPFTCANKPRCIPAGTASGGSCTWQRRLCVTCRVDSGVTKIHVQTNNLPNHCIQSDSVNAMDFDFEVVFNRKQTHGTLNKNIRNQNQLNKVVCPIAKRYDATALGIVENGADAGESTNAMGFALNGVAFQFANQIEEDPVYPTTVTNEQPLDICLGHNQQGSESGVIPSGMYHYHELSPCLNASFLSGKAMSDCASNAGCKADIAQWSLTGYEGATSRTVVGIAKDGHVLYGPYDDAGKLWQTAGVDACNGAWSFDLADYYYVGTRWHPYLNGCFGPASAPQGDSPPMYAQCSLNGMDKYVGVAGPASSPSPSTSSPGSSPSSSPQDNTQDNTALIAGVVAGVVGALLIVAGGVACYYYKVVRMRPPPAPPAGDTPEYANSCKPNVA